MATTQITRTPFALQAAGEEVTWTLSWNLTVDDWFNFQLVAKLSRLFEPDGQLIPTSLVITGQGVIAKEFGAEIVHPWVTIRNDSAGGHAAFAFTGLRALIE